jgi:hypothetical protein
MKKKDLNEITKILTEISTINMVYRQNTNKLLSILNDFTTKTLELDKQSIQKLEELKKLLA